MFYKIYILFFISVFLISYPPLYAQEKVEIKIVKNKELNLQTRVALWGTALPGGGQIYLKKYWKLPILYGVLLFGGYTIHSNHIFYMKTRNALAYMTDADPNTHPASIEPIFSFFSVSNMRQRRDFYRRERDYWIIITSIFYVLGLVEAVVDAHLLNFNVQDDISSLQITPILFPTLPKNDITMNYGIKIQYSF